jgi:hypothetical protein
MILPVTEASHAVFLSYASQDAQAAQRICEALRAAGIEVWFDQSELRCGDCTRLPRGKPTRAIEAWRGGRCSQPIHPAAALDRGAALCEHEWG